MHTTARRAADAAAVTRKVGRTPVRVGFSLEGNMFRGEARFHCERSPVEGPAVVAVAIRRFMIRYGSGGYCYGHAAAQAVPLEDVASYRFGETKRGARHINLSFC
mmetsp:Transcript_26801/g.41411  ORF Transcript_26801/g.41411 Transcript_26801/m.41411 type:complete len:105 (+) Transcript_26801:458-772(+)